MNKTKKFTLEISKRGNHIIQYGGTYGLDAVLRKLWSENNFEANIEDLYNLAIQYPAPYDDYAVETIAAVEALGEQGLKIQPKISWAEQDIECPKCQATAGWADSAKDVVECFSCHSYTAV